MASEKAKELAAKQKAQIKAEKLRKKNSTDPADWGRTRQVVEVYKITAASDPKLNLWMAVAAVGAFAVTALLGVLTNTLWFLWVLIGLLAAFAAALAVLTRRAKNAAFARSKGQPGSAQMAFQSLNAKKYSYTLAITANRTMDMVHRVVGQGGIVLVGEGQPGRLKQLMATEQKKHESVVHGVKVSQALVGDGPGQVKLEDLQKHLEKMPKVLQPYQIAEVNQRLRALDAVRPKAPLPKGPLPTPKGVNRAMRGR